MTNRKVLGRAYNRRDWGRILYKIVTFASYLREGETIIKAYFLAGHYGEASVEDASHYQRVLCIPQTLNETIYTPRFDYEYDASDVKILTRDIQDDFR